MFLEVPYYPHRDSNFPELDSKQLTSSEYLARQLPESKIVKAFNAILMVPDFEQHGRPAGHMNRRALPLAGDDAAAKKIVADLCDQFGYDPIDAGSLAESWRFEPNTPMYCVSFNKEWIHKALDAAQR